MSGQWALAETNAIGMKINHVSFTHYWLLTCLNRVKKGAKMNDTQAFLTIGEIQIQIPQAGPIVGFDSLERLLKSPELGLQDAIKETPYLPLQITYRSSKGERKQFILIDPGMAQLRAGAGLWVSMPISDNVVLDTIMACSRSVAKVESIEEATRNSISRLPDFWMGKITGVARSFALLAGPLASLASELPLLPSFAMAVGAEARKHINRRHHTATITSASEVTAPLIRAITAGMSSLARASNFAGFAVRPEHNAMVIFGIPLDPPTKISVPEDAECLYISGSVMDSALHTCKVLSGLVPQFYEQYNTQKKPPFWVVVHKPETGDVVVCEEGKVHDQTFPHRVNGITRYYLTNLSDMLSHLAEGLDLSDTKPQE